MQYISRKTKGYRTAAAITYLGQLARENVTRRRLAKLPVRFGRVELQKMTHASKGCNIARDVFDTDLRPDHERVNVSRDKVS